MSAGDEFYIGYEPHLPPRMGRRLRVVAAALSLAAVIAAGLALVGHDRLEPARFDFGRPSRVSGVLAHAPYPSLVVDDRRLWLAGQGKHGAEPLVAHVAEGPVTLDGALIARGTHQMLEVVPGSVTAAKAVTAATAAAAGPPAHTRTPGEDVTLRGEIVDGKCFLGVMNPGEGTVHRDCARLCLRGGLPPMLLVRGSRGEEALVLLVSAAGAAIGRELADIAGVPVEVRGRLIRDRGTLTLRADTDAYRRLPAPP